MNIPRIVLTSGEPAGIGPDLCLRVAQRDWPCELVIAADETMLRERAELLGIQMDIQPYEPANASQPSRAGRLLLLHEPAVAVTPGVLDTNNSPYVLHMLDLAIDGCVSGEFQAMVTAPVQKSVIADTGVPFTGHTEYLAERTHTPLPVMMLTTANLRVALATIHLPLNRVSEALSTEQLLATIRVIDSSLRQHYGLARPRILVCGLNPHAGESGHLGHEDNTVIAPALELARAEGIDVSGPAPADTAFTPRSLAKADVVLAMYHDQGLPVIKYAGFGNAVNVTLGLPIIRTSVDHGTALDLAGTNEVDAGSLIAAIEHAMELVRKSVASQTA